MTKGFAFCLAGLIGLAYFIRHQDPSGKAYRGRGGGAAVEVQSGMFASMVMGSEVPVVVYFWAPW